MLEKCGFGHEGLYSPVYLYTYVVDPYVYIYTSVRKDLSRAGKLEYVQHTVYVTYMCIYVLGASLTVVTLRRRCAVISLVCAWVGGSRCAIQYSR